MPSPDYGDNVVSLVDALKKSLAEEVAQSDATTRTKRSPRQERRAAAERTKAPRAKAPAKTRG